MSKSRSTVSRLPSTPPTLLAIVGPTASGKSALALKIAQKYNGEIITADSRTIYRGMDIGTAKPTTDEQKKIPHWGLDLVEPGQRYSAYKFKKYAKAKIKEIQNRGKLPILVGGTGLYVDALLFDFGFRAPPDPQTRAELEKLSIDELQGIIHEQGLPLAKNVQNPRHLIRIIETSGQVHRRKAKLDPGVLLIGLSPPDDALKHRINKRVEQIFDRGVVEETRRLVDKYGEEAIAKTGGIVYRLCLAVLKGEIIQSEALSSFKTKDWQYARRQKTWFKRNPHIQWFDNPKRAFEYISSML